MSTGIDLFEEHGEVSALWQRGGYRDRTVVCFDRHLDLKPLAPGGADALRRTVAVGGDPSAMLRRLPVRGVPGAFGLDDFWCAAALAGGLTSLVWVPSWPAHPGWRTTATDAVSLVAAGPEPLEPLASACCLTVTLCGVQVSVVPPSLLARHRCRHITGDVVVDIDLDWLMDEHGTADHDVDDLADLVEICGGEVSAMTWSTRSGFLPAEYRHVGRDVAGRLGRTVTASSFLPPTPWPEDVLLDVHRGVAPPEFTVAAGEPGANAVAVALRGLAVAQDDPDAADLAYEAAADLGYRSSWLAYRSGIGHYRRGDHTTARDRLRSAVAVDPTDTLAMHARILAARATARLDGPAAASTEFGALARMLPLRAGLWRTVRALAIDRGTVEEAEQALARIARLTDPDQESGALSAVAGRVL